jgi:hypothetical protein
VIEIVAVAPLFVVRPARDEMHPSRPPLNWSSVAICRAASVGAVKPGRCASMKWMRSVTVAA